MGDCLPAHHHEKDWYTFADNKLQDTRLAKKDNELFFDCMSHDGKIVSSGKDDARRAS